MAFSRLRRSKRIKPPVFAFRDALDAAREGQEPSFTTDSLLGQLSLDGDTPDGKQLIDRFTHGSRRVSVLRAVLQMMTRADELMDATNEHTANPAQETLAKHLGIIVTRQLTRENDVCPGASDIALSSTRDDIVPREVKRDLAIREISEAVAAGELPVVVIPVGLLRLLGEIETPPLPGPEGFSGQQP